MSDAPARGAVAPEVAAEFPALGLAWIELDGVVPGRSPPWVRARLAELSSRLRGRAALELRRRPVPHAYRVFLRQSGVDPDVARPPGEEAIVRRLLAGGLRSEGVVDDALTIALVETDVPVWALDRDRVAPPLAVRLARPGERIGRAADAAPALPGRMVVSDRDGPVAELLDAPGLGCGPTRRSRRLALYALRVAGVPEIHLEEALWTCAELLRASGRPTTLR